MPAAATGGAIGGAAPASGTGRDRAGHGILANLEAQALVFDFELRQLVLAHEVENLLQLVEVHQMRSNV